MNSKRFTLCIDCLLEKNNDCYSILNEKMICLCRNGIDKKSEWFNPHNVSLPSKNKLCWDCNYKLEHEILGQNL